MYWILRELDGDYVMNEVADDEPETVLFRTSDFDRALQQTTELQRRLGFSDDEAAQHIILDCM